MRFMPRSLGRFAVLASGVFWMALVGVPLLAVIFQARGAWRLAFTDPSLLAITEATLAQAGLSTLLAAALGIPLGLWLGSRQSNPATESLSEAALILPYGIPTVVVAVAWVSWLGRSGFLARLDLGYSLSAVIIAHVFLNAPWIAVLVARARREIPQAQLDAAATLGAGALARLRWIVWPGVSFAAAAAVTQVLALCSMSFAIVLILGGGPSVQTLETALYSRLRLGSAELPGAVACGLLELAITLVPWMLWALLETLRGDQPARGGDAAPRSPRLGDSPSFSWRRLGLVGACLVFCLPYLAVISPALMEALWSDPTGRGELVSALQVSLGLALASSLAAVVLALLFIVAIAYLDRDPRARTIGILLASAPGGISVMVLGLGFWLAYGSWIDPFEKGFVAVVALQSAIFSPVAFRVFWPVLHRSQRALLEAAATLGASPSRAFWLIEWPRWKGPLLTALALVAGASLGEVAAVSLFYQEGMIPLPLLISRWMGQYRFAEAQAVSGFLLVLSAIVMTTVSAGGRLFERAGR